MLSMGWWALELTWIRFSFAGWPQPTVPPGWGHATLMQYGLFPTFMFGFLLTVFPRWLGRPALTRMRYLPVAAPVLGGYVLANVGLLGTALTAGRAVVDAARLLCRHLDAGAVLLASSEGNDHARSCLLAVVVGTLGLIAFVALLFGAPGECATLAIKLGTFGLLLPIYFSVTHRMLPFFSGNVIAGYRMTRPRWSLPLIWPLLLAHCVAGMARCTGLAVAGRRAAGCWCSPGMPSPGSHGRRCGPACWP